ncbi:signal peptidase I [Candidatus Bathyarchaeota archaeon]|jgi:signal peptidase I|nr:signal peptidase I [Candidatus Bathyarchaeota archaeon]MBT7186609.1 signal peptidase I [Candidatus Bathyarchaeota archaeon]MBT7345505.1 signal peptidase I [Candidatus Bathyarchaeota archaeon]
MNSAKVFSVVSLASATTVASFMALMIIRGTMPIIQMAPFIGLNGAIVGGLFYLGVDSITSFSAQATAANTPPKLVMVRDNNGRVLTIKSEGAQQQQEDQGFSLFGGGQQEEYEEFEDEFLEEVPISQRLGLSSEQMIETIKTLLLVALIVETYVGVAYVSNNFTPFMVVTSDSMVPLLHIGDMIYVKGVAANDIKIGDVITFKPPTTYLKGGTLITHRVISIEYDSNEVNFKTQGDNNPSVDPWRVKSSDVVGRQTALIAGVGNYFLWMRTPAGMATIGVILVLFLFWPNIMDTIGGKPDEY